MLLWARRPQHRLGEGSYIVTQTRREKSLPVPVFWNKLNQSDLSWQGFYKTISYLLLAMNHRRGLDMMIMMFPDIGLPGMMKLITFLLVSFLSSVKFLGHEMFSLENHLFGFTNDCIAQLLLV